MRRVFSRARYRETVRLAKLPRNLLRNAFRARAERARGSVASVVLALAVPSST